MQWTRYPGLVALAVGLAMASPARSKTYQALPAKSRIAYTIVHPWHEVVGVSQDFQCRVDLGDDTLRSVVHVKIPVMSFNSENGSRDSKVLEIVDAFHFPFVEFVSDSIQRHGQYFRVFGQITFHGVQKPVQFLVVPRMLGGFLHVIGEFDLKLTDFKVEPPTFMFTHTHNDFHVDFDIVADKPATVPAG